MSDSISPKWYEWAIKLEQSHNGSFDAGLIPHQFEKFFDQLENSRQRHLAPLTFYYFVHYSRRKRGLTVKDLSQQAGIDFDELMALERDTQYKLKSESVIKLAKYFGVDENGLIKMAKLDKPHRDPTWEEPAAQFPDMVDSTEELGDIALMVVMGLEKFLAEQARKTNLKHAA